MKFVTKTILAAILVAGALPTLPAGAAETTRVGALECDVSGGVGIIITSSKALDCWFFRDDGAAEHYVGTISRFGVALGATGPGHLDWAVFAPTVGLHSGELAGDYGGVGASATAGVGLGANMLVGGSGRSFNLQPFSMQAQVGVDVAAGVTAMALEYAPPPPAAGKPRARRHRR
ncbi:MAG TPA: DUF992 domain-containing protein [Rhodoblastus sp.]|nr:DUF992 domain-containing protein [Rhodoblastus sp.]